MPKIVNRVVSVFYYFLLVISLLGAISLLTTHLTELSNISIFILDVIALVGIICLFALEQASRHEMMHKAQRIMHLKTFKVVLFVIVCLWQLLMIRFVSGTSIWDPGIITLKAVGEKQWVHNYFSYNSNTLFLMFFERTVWFILGKTSLNHLIYALNCINAILVDTSLICLFKTFRSTLADVGGNIWPLSV